MKKLLIILLLSPVFLNLNGQNLLLRTPQGKVLSFGDEGLSISEYELVITDYFDRNPHYSRSFKNELEVKLNELLDPEYIMPDSSENYYNTFISENGQGRLDSDWFYILKIDGSLTSRTVLKSGDLLKWHLGDSIYNQNNLPDHTHTPGQDFLFLTCTDDYAGITAFNLSVNNFIDEIAFFDFENIDNLNLNNSGFSGDLTQYLNYLASFTNLDFLDISSNSFTGDWTDLNKLSVLTGMQVFLFDNNNIAGNVNSWSQLSSWTNIMQFFCNNNNLSGDASSWSSWSSWVNITQIRVQFNSIYGDISSWSTWSAMTDLNRVYLNDNSFNADISSWSTWSSLTSIIQIRLQNNELYGDMSSCSTWSTMTSLQQLYFYNNQFSFDAASWSTFSTMTSIQQFIISGNSIYGNASSWNFTWPDIALIQIQDNQITGTNYIPTTSISEHNASINNITSTTIIDNIFLNYDTYYSSNTPIQDLTINVGGGTNASPTGGASNTNIQNLITTFSNAGYTFTYIIN